MWMVWSPACDGTEKEIWSLMGTLSHWSGALWATRTCSLFASWNPRGEQTPLTGAPASILAQA